MEIRVRDGEQTWGERGGDMRGEGVLGEGRRREKGWRRFRVSREGEKVEKFMGGEMKEESG